MKNKILFIGGINKGNQPKGGASAKNQILLRKLQEQFDGQVKNIDVSRYEQTPILLGIIIFFHILKYSRIVISTPSPGLSKIAFLNPILKNKRVTIFIIGGVIYKKLGNNRLRIILENAGKVFAETQELSNQIQKVDNKINVECYPNFKYQFRIPLIKKDFSKRIKFIYLSRINTQKGVFRSIEIVNKLNNTDPDIEYSMDIYGSLDFQENEEIKFNQLIENNNFINYRGLIDLRNKEGFKVISHYHFLLFLTNHEGEGFPGTILDAMISKVPIIASDWNYNREIMTTENGILGKIVDLQKDYVSEAIKFVMEMKKNPKAYAEIQHNLEFEAEKYNAEKLILDIY